jgi:hypothetical protein
MKSPIVVTLSVQTKQWYTSMNDGPQFDSFDLSAGHITLKASREESR